MPERWEWQIRKLREVEPGPDLGARFEEGPRGEPTPTTRQRVVAAVTALALFVAAWVFAVRVFGPGSEEPRVVGAAGAETSLVLELSSEGNQPTATLRYGEKEQDGVREGYEWCEGDGCVGGIGDFVRYPPVSELLVVPPSTPLEVSGDGSIDGIQISRFGEETVRKLKYPWSVPATNGTYAVEVDATWDGDPGGSANFFFGVQTLDDPASAPDVLHVDCGFGSAFIDSAVVRTQADGLHVELSGAEGFAAYSVVKGEGDPAEYAVVGSDVPEDGSDVLAAPPGRWEIGCSERGEQVDTDATATFELVDPDDHYAPFELSCRDATELQFTSTAPGSTPHEEAAASLLTGLTDDDRLRGAGYGVESWIQGPTYVVDRGGDAVARLTLYADSDPWGGIFTACVGSGIDLGETAGVGGAGSPSPVSSPEPSPPAEDEIPDVLVVRCEGLGPAVDATEVRLQEDGLHVDAINVADAEVVLIRALVPDQEMFVHRTAFEEAEESYVVEGIEAGTIWVGCRVTDENGEIVGGLEEVPGGDVQVEVLSP